MLRRCALFLLLAMTAGTTGCATSARRIDGTPMFGGDAWSQAPAPPQAPLATANSRTALASESSPKPEGLARYFPGLQRNPTEPPRSVARYRPTWFGLRPYKVVDTQLYMTDSRASLGRMGPEPTSLPVALQVPSDRAVTPTGAETVRTDPVSNSPVKEADPSKPIPPGSVLPDFGGKPSAPGEDEVNPLPPAAEPGVPAPVANRMPDLPAADPRERPKMDSPKSEKSASSDEKSEKAAKSTVPPSEPLETTSYSSQPTTQLAGPTQVHARPTTVTASPQSAPPRPGPQSRPRPPAKPSPQVTPTSQIKPTPQSEAKHIWKRPCLLKRLIHKSCKPGDCVYATVAPSPQ